MSRPGRREDARWSHAARVAAAATALVGVVAVLLALVANAMILDRLTTSVDAHLSSQLAAATAGGVVDPVAVSGQSADLDDAPVLFWRVTPSGRVRALTAGAPALPAGARVAGPVTVDVPGGLFRFVSAPLAGGRLVAGESVLKLRQARDDLLIAEGLLGALLLVVTFAGSFVIGLRASAPIEQIRRRQAAFTADASHELRTPLAVIQAEVDLALTRRRDPEEYEDSLRRVAAESGRLRSIVDDLLWLARADELPPAPAGGSVDVAAVAASCAGRFEALAAARGSILRLTVPSAGGVVDADEESVDRLVTVLLDNALRYAGPGATVDLSVTHRGGRVVLTVDDSGPGIPEDQWALVLDRFHRADHRPGGTGLGLAIADTVVRRTGGTWEIGRSPDGGARMAVTWPTGSAPARSGERADAEVGTGSGIGTGGRSGHPS